MNSTTHTESGSPPGLRLSRNASWYTETYFSRLLRGSPPIELTIKASSGSFNIQPRPAWNSHHPASASWEWGLPGMCYSSWLQAQNSSMKARETACLWMATSVTLLCMIVHTAKIKIKNKKIKMVATHTTPFNWRVHVHLTQHNKLFNFYEFSLSLFVCEGGVYMWTSSGCNCAMNVNHFQCCHWCLPWCF